MKFDIKEILKKLFKERPIFHSEADFQFALAWKIKELNPESKIRLEMRSDNFDRKEYLDILVELDNKKYPIELKYKTKKLDYEWNDKDDKEKFNLSNQGAQDNGRYDFIKDISRIERIVDSISIGYAIFLTNDKSYWEASKNVEQSGYVDFRLDTNKQYLKNGKLKWGENITHSVNSGRKNELNLNGKYKLEWNNTENELEFKYLLVEVNKK